ncbi:MAG: methionine adenosyltransferase [Reyranellaceae bacterium]
MKLVVSGRPSGVEPVEIVERKGLGHPDSICDALAENLSRNLCRYYIDRYGAILHHNVDKALLCGGSAVPAFGGGRVTAPIDIYLSGRAVGAVGNQSIPVDEMAVEGSRTWLRGAMHALDVDRHVRLHSKVRPGSQALAGLHGRGAMGKMLANDTSIGVGYAPLSALEFLVLRVENVLNGRQRAAHHPAWGEDIKVMGVRHGMAVSLTIACAMVDRYISGVDDYRAEMAAIRRLANDLAAEHGFDDCRVGVNMADASDASSLYLTVTGTSAEAGDDGEVGRGNRVNGLITPYRPMSLEAAAGKNPVSHVGKIYNIIAREIAEATVSGIAEVAAAECHLVSQIGGPVEVPMLAHVRLATRDGSPVDRLESAVGDIVTRQLGGASSLVDRFVAGAIDVH